MKFNVTSDIPGRIRLRYGRDVFPLEREAAVAAYFTALPHVEAAQICCHTGSVLLHYTGDVKSRLLKAARDLRLSELVTPEPTEEAGAQNINEEFKDKIFSAIGWQLIRSYLLPSPLRQLVTIVRALKFMRGGLQCLKERRIGVEVLDASAVAVSIGQGNFRTASSIMFLLSVSDLLESYTVKKTKSMLSASLMVHADTVWVDRSGRQVQIPMKELELGERVIVRTGSIIPVDGTVRAGEAVVNQAAMTGEPLGVFKKAGDSVFAGTVIEDGDIIIEVRALLSNTRISGIVDMISDSEDLKASVQGKAERLADKIVPFSFLLAAGVFVFTRNLTKALSVLLVDYSCAVKLATPISVISAMREASAHKVVVKGGKFFEAIAEADTIVFDKTGTLTVASPTVSRVVPMGDYSREEVLRLSACIEEHYPHSVARAVVRAAQAEDLHHEEEHTEVEYIVAHGIATTIHGKKAVIGSAHFVFEDEGVPLSAGQRLQIDAAMNGDSAIFLAIDGALVGMICISDPPRLEAAETIRRLRALGIREVIMITGDGEAAAKVVSRQLGVDRYFAQVLPQDKAEIVEALKKDGRKVIMVGDGVNDSPALAAADVSVSMKDSSDIAREVADITMLSSDLNQLVTVRLLGQRLMTRIQQNFNFIAVFNTALLALGLGNVLTPGTTALLHNASTIAVSAAGLRPSLPKALRDQGAFRVTEGEAALTE